MRKSSEEETCERKLTTMKIEEIKAICAGPKERGCRNKELCGVLSRIDEAFIYHTDRDILIHSTKKTLLKT